MTRPFDPSGFTLWRRGRFFEDFHVGQRIDHHWGRTVREYDSVLFNSLTLNYLPVYSNAEFAASLGLPAQPVNPYFVFLVVMGMSVEDTSEGVNGADGAFLGVESVDFIADVFADDTVTATTVVEAVRPSASRPKHGIVTWRTTGINQDDTKVLEFVRTNLVVRRPDGEE